MKCDGLWDICVAFLVGGIYVLSANTTCTHGDFVALHVGAISVLWEN